MLLFIAATPKRRVMTMRKYWWNGGLHFEPETDREREALLVLGESLNLVEVDQGIPTGPIGIGEFVHEKSVVGVHVSADGIA